MMTSQSGESTGRAEPFSMVQYSVRKKTFQSLPGAHHCPEVLGSFSEETQLLIPLAVFEAALRLQMAACSRILEFHGSFYLVYLSQLLYTCYNIQ